jgi:hypothetical protein
VIAGEGGSEYPRPPNRSNAEEKLMPLNFVGPMIVTLLTFAAGILLTRWGLAHARFKREAEMQLQLHTRLIDKFGTPKELGEYLQSDAGRAFLTPPPAERATPYRRILASAQVGIILTFVGVAIWIFRGDSLGPGSDSRQLVRTLSALGGITFALGLGFVASAILAYVLSSRWGLFNGKHAPTDEAP